MASPNDDDANIPPGTGRFAPALRFGSVLLTAAWVAGAALAGEPALPPASAPGDAVAPGQSGQAPEDDASEPLAKELAGARREVELLQHLSQEHERAERLDQNLAAARRDLDAQAAKAKEEVAQIKKTSEAAAADLRQAAQKERERAEALAADLTKLRLELYANQAQAAKAADEAAELRRQIAGSGPASQPASEDKDRIAVLERDLAAARRDLDGRTTLLAKTRDEAAQLKKVSEAGNADLRQAAQKERERAEALAADLTKVRLELNANQAQAAKASDEAAELRRQIAGSGPASQRASEDKDRIAVLERDLAAARRDLDGRTTLLAKVRDEAAQLKKVSEAGNVDLKQATQKERERAEALAGELAKVRGDLQANRVQAAKAADEAAELQREIAAAATARQSTAAEKERAARLERDLGATRRDLEAQVALAEKSRNDAERLREASERDAASLREQLRLERSRADSLERDLAAASSRKDLPLKGSSRAAATTGPVSPSVGGAPMALTPVAAPAAAVAAPAVKPTPERPTPEMAAASVGLVARASSLLGQGDIIAARTVLERAAEMGSAQASFALAETYDPSVLAKWGTYGTRGDPAMARDLYAKAVAGGIKEAKQRAEALRR